MDWSYFDKFEYICDRYMPTYGEGDVRASQIVTAISKLIYKWYNDGDVFDNTYYMTGWANDLSSYANWLERYVNAGDILSKIRTCHTDNDYEKILAELADRYLNEEFLADYEDMPKGGSIYNCIGSYEFREDYDDEDSEYYDEDEDDEYSDYQW